jgi:hypothetical protein
MNEVTERPSIAFRGGAADGLGYAPIFKEIAEKKIKFDVVSGASFGAIASAIVSHGYSYEYTRKLFLSIKGDLAMKWERDVEQSKNIFTKIFKGAFVLLGTKTFIFNSFEKVLKKNFSWDRATYANEVYLCFAPLEYIGAYDGDNKVEIGDLIKLMKAKGDPKTLAPKIRPMYCAKDGVYEYNPVEKKMTKISNEIIPMHIAILVSFYNQALKKIVLEFNGQKWHPFDGGILNNEGNCAQKDENFIQAICGGEEPPPIGVKREVERDMMEFSDFYYNFNRPKRGNVFFFPPKDKNLGFLNFNNEAVNKEFKDVVASNIFKV